MAREGSLGSWLRLWYFKGGGKRCGRAWTCAKEQRGSKTIQRVDLIKIRHPTRVPYREEMGVGGESIPDY